jgi:hypothetical protein
MKHWTRGLPPTSEKCGQSSDALIRSKDWQIKNAKRRVVQIEALIMDLRHRLKLLESDIQLEEKGISDPKHINYPCVARAMRARRENLFRSIVELEYQLKKPPPVPFGTPPSQIRLAPAPDL